MSEPEATTEAVGPRLGGAGFWTFAAFTALVVVAAAFPTVRTVVLWIATLPFRAAGWILPGATIHADAAAAASLLGWLGWAALGFLWAPLLMLALGAALRAAPFLERWGAAWSEAIRGGRGRPLMLGAWSIALAPAVLTVLITAARYLLPWALGPAMLASAALIAPALLRGEEHPAVALVRRTSALVDSAVALVGDAARWASLALVLVIAVAVTQRYVFGITFTKLDELVVYLHAAMFMLVAAAALKVDAHVRVDVFYGSMPPRRRALINFLGVYLLLAPMCLVILFTSGGYVDLAWRVQEGSTEGDGLPLVFLLKTVIPAFAALLLAQAAAIAAREALVLAGVEEAAPASPLPHEAV